MVERKSRILYIKRYLEENSDEQHQKTVTDILAHLTGQGITATRKTVAQDIELLIEAGVDVVINKSRPNKYFVGIRHIELPKLKLLIDAAQASKFLTVKRSRDLIGDLLSLTSIHQAEDLKRGLYFDNQVKPKNENAYRTANLLLKAIIEKKRVRFMYYEYAPNKEKVYKHNRRVYEFSPWTFLWNNDHYYIAGHSENHGQVIKFRVDRIASPKETMLDAASVPDDFDPAVIAKTVFSMYEGPMLDVTLKCDNAMMKTIVDRFGEDVKTEISDPEHFHAKVTVSASKTFYGWVFGMDGAIRITAPREAVDTYNAMLHKAKTLVP